MNGESIGSDFGPKPEQTEAKRRKYLEALAISIGANETTVRMSVDALLRNPGAFESIDFTKGKLEQDPEIAQQVEELGSWFLTGSRQRDQLAFTVGSRVLSLLREDPNSGHFKNLGEWVNMWTDGEGSDKFNEMTKE